RIAVIEDDERWVSVAVPRFENLFQVRAAVNGVPREGCEKFGEVGESCAVHSRLGKFSVRLALQKGDEVGDTKHGELFIIERRDDVALAAFVAGYCVAHLAYGRGRRDDGPIGVEVV